MNDSITVTTDLIRNINAVTAFAVLQNIAGMYLIAEDRITFQHAIKYRRRYRIASWVANSVYVLLIAVGAGVLYQKMQPPDAFPIFLMNILKALAVGASGSVAIVALIAWAMNRIAA